MSTTNLVAALGAAFTGLATCVAAATFIYTWWRSRLDQRHQRAAQTREDLLAIIGDFNRFLRPLSQSYPYPIFHTATAITKEFCTRMKTPARQEDVLDILNDKELLLSICVEGWIASTQVGRMLDIAEELERKSSSHRLRGKLLLICHASFMLAGLVAKICSPESFYEMLSKLEVHGSRRENVENLLNTITVELQQSICKAFNTAEHRDTFKRSLYFIQTAAKAFISLKDKELVQLAEYRGKDAPLASLCNATDPSIKTDPIIKIEEEALLLNRVVWVKTLLKGLERNICKDNYTDLCELIDPIEKTCRDALNVKRAILS